MSAITPASVSMLGIPVSMPNCASGPLPLTHSPINAAANPNCATLPTNNSLERLNPNLVMPKNYFGCNMLILGSYAGPSGRLDWISFSCGLKVAEFGKNAAIKLNAANPATSTGTSLSGSPVSTPNYAMAPLPVKTSPISADAKPSMASRPTNRSLPLVNPRVPKLKVYGKGAAAWRCVMDG